jgi:hypothetical protein
LGRIFVPPNLPRHALAHGFCLTRRWREMDSNFWFRAEIRFGPGLLDRHRVPWSIASAATPGHHPARFPSLGARRRRPLPRPARPALAVELRSMLAETEAKFASVGPTAEEDIGPALAPHLVKPDRDVDPGSGAGGHRSAVGERPEPSTRINKRRISSGRKRDRGARTWPRPCRRCCTR